ncbi:hypothetical protein PLICRDRAFT_597375 [Plicaturopsis crispa FD-325 SS-3]|nr:hypothetical protein PLICRDRAFT_597375 [Plicaturopsis crispa FD-325 SS-3]
MEITSGNEEEDAEGTPVPPPKGKRAAATNGKAAAKGKGKSKADVAAKAPVRKAAEDNDIQVIEDTDAETFSKPVRTAAAAARSQKKPAAAARASKGNDALQKEIDRLQQRLKDSESQRQALSHQVEELVRIRRTEPEEALAERSAVYEKRISTQEEMIKVLTGQLSRVEGLGKSGKAPFIQFLTREAADEEKRALEQEVSQWRETAQEKDTTLRLKDERIAELEQLERDLRHELRLEVQRSQSLASKARTGPPSAQRPGRPGGVLGSDNPHNADVVKFYEDLTNLLVINKKNDRGEYYELVGVEDTVFICVYSNSQDIRGNAQEKSLSFSLRIHYALSDPEYTGPVTSMDQLTESVKYTPLELEKESPEYLEQLAFFNNAFTFVRDQFPTFLNTLYKNMYGVTDDDEAVAEDNSGEEEAMDEDL